MTVDFIERLEKARAEQKANERSVGDVPAPVDGALEKLIRTDASAEAGYDLGVNAERAAVVKYLRAQPRFYSRDLDELVSAIEKGEHVK